MLCQAINFGKKPSRSITSSFQRYLLKKIKFRKIIFCTNIFRLFEFPLGKISNLAFLQYVSIEQANQI